MLLLSLDDDNPGGPSFSSTSRFCFFEAGGDEILPSCPTQCNPMQCNGKDEDQQVMTMT